MATEGTPRAIQCMAQAHARFGTTAMLPTTISADDQTLASAIAAGAEATGSDTHGAEIIGLHLEGPFLNQAKGGAHRREFLRSPSVEIFDQMWDQAQGTLKIISLAPEMDGAARVIERACERNVIPALAHSDADYAQTFEAIGRGLRLCAHLFNAMPPLTHRSPGPIAAFLNSEHTFVELIADGFHVHPAAMEVAIRAKGVAGVILVTDAVTPAGTELKSFTIQGVQLEVRGKSCFTPDGNLAGSALTMNEAVRVVAAETATSLGDAVKMASINPARLLGIADKKGSLAVGKDADVVITDSSLNVLVTVVAGRAVYGA